MKKVSFITFLLSTIFISQALSAQNVFKAQEKLIGTKIETLQFGEYYSDKSNIEEIDEKFKVLEFWASWCKPCLKAVPHLNKLSENFEKESNLLFISIGYENQAIIEKVLTKVKFKTLVVSDQTKKIHRDLHIEYKGTMILPRTVLINDKNEILWYGTPERLNNSLIEKFLDGKREF